MKKSQQRAASSFKALTYCCRILRLLKLLPLAADSLLLTVLLTFP